MGTHPGHPGPAWDDGSPGWPLSGPLYRLSRPRRWGATRVAAAPPWVAVLAVTLLFGGAVFMAVSALNPGGGNGVLWTLFWLFDVGCFLLAYALPAAPWLAAILTAFFVVAGAWSGILVETMSYGSAMGSLPEMGMVAMITILAYLVLALAAMIPALLGTAVSFMVQRTGLRKLPDTGGW